MCDFLDIYKKNNFTCGFYVCPPDDCNLVLRVVSVYGVNSGRLPSANSNFVKNYQRPAIYCELFEKVEDELTIILNPVFEYPSKDNSGYPTLYGVCARYNFFNSYGKRVLIKNTGLLTVSEIPVVNYFDTIGDDKFSVDECISLISAAESYSVRFHYEYRMFIIWHAKDAAVIKRFREIFNAYGTTYFSYEYGARFVDCSEINNVKTFIEYLKDYYSI